MLSFVYVLSITVFFSLGVARLKSEFWNIMIFFAFIIFLGIEIFKRDYYGRFRHDAFGEHYWVPLIAICILGCKYFYEALIEYGNISHGKSMFKLRRVSKATHNKNSYMGTSASNFFDKSLDIQLITIVKLTYSAFGHLDRQVSASVEANLNIRPNQRKNVQRLLAQVIDEKPSLANTLRPLKRMQQGGHNAAYGIFDKLCIIAVDSKRYNQASLNNLIAIAQQLGLSQEEIYYLFQKSRLAV